MPDQPQAWIFDAVRTPRGRGRPGGSLYEVKPIDLVTGLLHALTTRNPTLDPALIGDVVLGIVSATGEQGGVLPRAAVLAAGWPHSVAGVQLDRFCGSGLEAVNTAAARVRAGFADLVLAGGVESMSRVPMGSAGGAIMNDPATAWAANFVPQGVSADLLATLEGFTREDLDAYAASSHARAATAWREGRFERSVVPVRDANGLVVLGRDELIRPGVTRDSLAGLAPSFQAAGEAGFDSVALETYHWVDEIHHLHHPGNSSGLADGASLVLIGSEEAGRSMGLTPRARIVSVGLVGSEPTIMLTGPVRATQVALDRVRLSTADIDLVEVNEAFAAVPLHFMGELGFTHEVTNVNGGAISMGHPLGATGAMLLCTVLDELERRDARRGLVTLCIGGGMGIATVIERT
ncbi:MAG: acetyl-CoA C-acetyltransferase [Dermatophilaceae bacterium]